MQNGRIIHWGAGPLLAVVGLLCLASPVAGEYLCSVGPAPLRWRLPVPPRPELLRSLPALSTGREETAANASSDAAAASVAGPTAPATTSRSELASASPASVAGTNDLSAALGQVVPTDLINTLFYSPGGTNRMMNMVVPLNFVAPPLTPQRSSSATYSNDKP